MLACASQMAGLPQCAWRCHEHKSALCCGASCMRGCEGLCCRLVWSFQETRVVTQAEERAARPVTAGGTAVLPGRKSAAAEEEAMAAAKAARKKARKGGEGAEGGERKRRGAYSSSSAYFGMLQDERDAAAAALDGKLPPRKKARPAGQSSKALKL